MAAKLKIEKRGDEIKKKIFSSETTEPISTDEKREITPKWVMGFTSKLQDR
jgi:hypothetical protein